jgi:hypothetical protein
MAEIGTKPSFKTAASNGGFVQKRSFRMSRGRAYVCARLWITTRPFSAGTAILALHSFGARWLLAGLRLGTALDPEPTLALIAEIFSRFSRERVRATDFHALLFFSSFLHGTFSLAFAV